MWAVGSISHLIQHIWGSTIFGSRRITLQGISLPMRQHMFYYVYEIVLLDYNYSK